MERTEASPVTNLVLMVSFTQTAKGMEQGLIKSQYVPFRVPFYGLADLIGEMDHICDYVDFPQELKNRRRLNDETFSEREPRLLMREHWKKKRNEMRGLLNLDEQRFVGFNIQILCRRHVSLQGLLHFRNERIAFRSAMELQNLILDALELAAQKTYKHVSLPLLIPPIPLSV